MYWIERWTISARQRTSHILCVSSLLLFFLVFSVYCWSPSLFFFFLLFLIPHISHIIRPLVYHIIIYNTVFMTKVARLLVWLRLAKLLTYKETTSKLPIMWFSSVYCCCCWCCYHCLWISLGCYLLAVVVVALPSRLQSKIISIRNSTQTTFRQYTSPDLIGNKRSFAISIWTHYNFNILVLFWLFCMCHIP